MSDSDKASAIESLKWQAEYNIDGHRQDIGSVSAAVAKVTKIFGPHPELSQIVKKYDRALREGSDLLEHLLTLIADEADESTAPMCSHALSSSSRDQEDASSHTSLNVWGKGKSKGKSETQAQSRVSRKDEYAPTQVFYISKGADETQKKQEDESEDAFVSKGKGKSKGKSKGTGKAHEKKDLSDNGSASSKESRDGRANNESREGTEDDNSWNSVPCRVPLTHQKRFENFARSVGNGTNDKLKFIQRDFKANGVEHLKDTSKYVQDQVFRVCEGASKKDPKVLPFAIILVKAARIAESNPNDVKPSDGKDVEYIQYLYNYLLSSQEVLNYVASGISNQHTKTDFRQMYKLEDFEKIYEDVRYDQSSKAWPAVYMCFKSVVEEKHAQLEKMSKDTRNAVSDFFYEMSQEL